MVNVLNLIKEWITNLDMNVMSGWGYFFSEFSNFSFSNTKKALKNSRK